MPPIRKQCLMELPPATQPRSGVFVAYSSRFISREVSARSDKQRKIVVKVVVRQLDIASGRQLDAGQSTSRVPIDGCGTSLVLV